VNEHESENGIIDFEHCVFTVEDFSGKAIHNRYVLGTTILTLERCHSLHGVEGSLWDYTMGYLWESSQSGFQAILRLPVHFRGHFEQYISISPPLSHSK
jgi:hypothetical protein